MSSTVLYRTLGCKQNQFDSYALQSRLSDRGFIETNRVDGADWVVLNTCAVTERAMAKARGEINRIRRRNPGAKIVALGCGSRYQADNFPDADFCYSLPPEFGLNRWIGESDESLPLPHGIFPEDKSRALLRIQSGCDQQCAFCIVPHLRGPSQSVPAELCVEALTGLVQQDAPEIVLTGTNIALWGRDLPNSPILIDLLKALLVKIGSARLRLSSLEPQLISTEFIDWCIDQLQICNHLHLAIQSGSNRIINRMSRGNPVAGFYEYLVDLKRKRADISIGADVMTGFPGETLGDFQETTALIESIPLSYLHVFPFSERPGTPAATFRDVVPIGERLRRAKILRELDAELRDRFAALNSEEPQDIVTIGNDHTDTVKGLTSNYLRVSFDGDFKPPGRRFRSVVSEASPAVSIK